MFVQNCTEPTFDTLWATETFALKSFFQINTERFHCDEENGKISTAVQNYGVR